jgi:hypothetical protein
MTTRWLVLNAAISALVSTLVVITLVNSNLPSILLRLTAPAPISPVVSRAHVLADNLDVFASLPTNDYSAQHAIDASRELRAQVEGDSSPQARVALALLPQVDAAIGARNQLDMNRLSVQLRNIR